MFVADNDQIVVQEYTTNHMGGRRHCSARLEADGCINSCFLGEMWNKAGVSYGGSIAGPGVPPIISDANKATKEELCKMVLNVEQTPEYESLCGPAVEPAPAQEAPACCTTESKPNNGICPTGRGNTYRCCAADLSWVCPDARSGEFDCGGEKVFLTGGYECGTDPTVEEEGVVIRISAGIGPSPSP